MRGLTVRGNPLRRVREMNPRIRATMHSRQFMDSPPRLNQHSVDCLRVLLHLWVNSYSVSLRLSVGGVVAAPSSVPTEIRDAARMDRVRSRMLGQ